MFVIYMNRNDIKLILILSFFLILFFLFRNFFDNDKKVANVYYNDNLIESISLSEDGIYTVDGYNGKVVMEVKDNKIRVIDETSKRNLCSKQGYGDIIICLPNKIVIKVENSDNELDGVVK